VHDEILIAICAAIAAVATAVAAVVARRRKRGDDAPTPRATPPSVNSTTIELARLRSEHDALKEAVLREATEFRHDLEKLGDLQRGEGGMLNKRITRLSNRVSTLEAMAGGRIRRNA
jgi:hypothetical protein